MPEEMFDERAMYIVQQKRITTRAWLLGIFIVTCGVLGFVYLNAKHIQAVAISVDACKMMCPGGIDRYYDGSCYCAALAKPPDPPKPKLLDCTCTPDWKSP
jgi:hypothetical protein